MFDACSIPLLILVGFFILSSIRVVYQYQRGVKFRLGKFVSVVDPGLTFIIPIIEELRIVDTRITTVDIPKQEVMTKDNVPVSVNGVVYFRVEDPKKAVLEIRNYLFAVSQYSQTALRDVIGNKDLDTLLMQRDEIAKEIKELVDRETASWGVDITAIKIQDIELPADMKRAMARQAEAERERRGIIIKSEGEKEAAKNLAAAAKMLSQTPGALHLRTLSTLADISGDPSSKIVVALPLEVLEAIQGFSKSKAAKK